MLCKLTTTDLYSVNNTCIKKTNRLLISLSQFSQTKENKDKIRNFNNHLIKNQIVPLNSPQQICKRLISSHKSRSIKSIADLLKNKKISKINLKVNHNNIIDKNNQYKLINEKSKLVLKNKQNTCRKESMSEVLIDNFISQYKGESNNYASKNFNYIHSEYLNSVISEESIFNLSKKCKFILF